MLNIDEIRSVTDKAREFASGCDRTNCGCQVPQVAKAINYTEALCDEVEADRDEIAVLKRGLEMACEEAAKSAQYKPAVPDACVFGHATIRAVAMQYERDVIQRAREEMK